MCGIIAVLQRPSDRPSPDARDLLERAHCAVGERPPGGAPWEEVVAHMERATAQLATVDALLRATPGIHRLVTDPTLAGELDAAAATCEARLGELEHELDSGVRRAPPEGVELLNAALRSQKDVLWAIRRDRLDGARRVAALAGASTGRAAVGGFAAIQTALSALDRLEVRGRDSAGLHVLVTGHGIDLDGGQAPSVLARGGDPLFTSTAVRTPNGQLSFVYKVASEIGELGDNVGVLRHQLEADTLLHQALEAERAEVQVVAHTRWASVGLINQANAHPLNQEETDAVQRPYVIAALNGDIDNYASLIVQHGLRIAPEITTDAKVIPVLTAHRLAEGLAPLEAFRQTVSTFDGSVAIAAGTADQPDNLLLALRGSGQALYVGLREDAFVVASEPYGLVEETGRYLRMDGEAASAQSGVQGQVVLLDRARAGTIAGIRRIAYDGTELPVGEEELQETDITTRDIDRGPHRHYLEKEISEAPRSWRNTLRGRVVEVDGRLRVRLGPETLPDRLRQRLADGSIQQVLVIGQGTAAVAGMSAAAAFQDTLAGRGPAVTALPATELSGFGLRDDMTDTMVVAISQSGTTTDTNRTVDLVRARGAAVVSIINRRSSDLTHKSDGVLFTSDGRDVEMSVASTKAYYAQVAAGFLLALAVAEVVGQADPLVQHDLLTALRDLPEAMELLLSRRERIREIVQPVAPAKRHWAVVGNGRNRIAAQEIRIKLSELCYKSIACDATEDKKHIDLSSEPMILVCAAGLGASAAGDVAKELEIFRAHKSVPVVIATEGDPRLTTGERVIAVPSAHPALAHVLATMAGHLFGYQAALSIDAQAAPLRQARAAVERVVARNRGGDLLSPLKAELESAFADFREHVTLGMYDGTLETSTAVRLASVLRYALQESPLDLYSLEFGKPATPGVILDTLTTVLTNAIDELTRPIDAIKHQAKTVTVGISRADESLVTVPLVREVLAAGADRERLSYETLRTLAALEPAVSEVVGYTRYQIEGTAGTGDARIFVLDKGGVSRDLASRAEGDHGLRGSKEFVATDRRVLATRGRSDGRTVIIVPEVKDNATTNLTLLQVRFPERLAAARMRRVLEGYRGRFAGLRGAVTETEPHFEEALLGQLPVVSLLTEPVDVVADRWRQPSD